MTLSEYRSLRKRMRVAAFTLFAFVAGFAAGAAPGFTGCTQQDLTPVPDTSALCPAAAAFADNAGSAQPEKWVCLTFDDGPSRTTPAVLAALDAAGVHGTFFVVATGYNEKYLPLLTQAAAAGHQIALHSGHDDGPGRVRRDALQAVGEQELHPVRHAEAGGVLPRLLQRLLAQVRRGDEGADALAQQVHSQISVVRADVGHARAGRH